jgi:lysophospholipase L1-like esterase
VPNRRTLILAVAALATGCGGGGSSPIGPPPPTEVYDLAGQVFLDENGNGAIEASEGTRVPGVRVQIAGRNGQSEKVSGRVVVTGVPGGSYSGGVLASSLPPFFQVGKAATYTVPQASGMDVPFALTLPIGSNRAYLYMGFGDSITNGDGSRSGEGYRRLLANDLRATFGRGDVLNEGTEGTKTFEGTKRLPGLLSVNRPAYTLILYGTNDWNSVECKNNRGCDTVTNLRTMVKTVKAAQSLPVVATIIPANPDYPFQVPPERNDWVHGIDVEIRSMAKEEGAVLADLEDVFLKQGDLKQLFADHVHPNDRGYELIAAEWFRAITQPSASTTSLDAGAQHVPSALDARPALRPAQRNDAPVVPWRGGLQRERPERRQ